MPRRHVCSARFRRRREGVKDPTIRRDISALSAVLAHAIRSEWTTQNFARVYISGRDASVKENEPRTRYLSHDEEKALIPHIPPATRRMAVFAIDTGLRKEEMLALLRTDVDIKKREITVRGITSKNSKMRRVPLHQRTYEMLRDMLAEPTRSLFLFHRSDGYRHSDKTRNLRRDLIIGATRAKLKEHLTWHDLRRTCGTRLIQDYKMPLHEVSIWLGHSDVKLTAKRYAFLGADALHDRLADAPKISATTLRLVKGKKDT
jgi:integrase/recombinase XerD